MKTSFVPPFWLSRREFLRTTALASLAAPFMVSCQSSRPRVIPANEKLRHACIGIGGMGTNDLKSLMQHERLQMVALCDVDSDRLKAAAQLAPGARLYSDWRELLEKEADRIDSVNVAVPDHSHFPIAYSAIQLGKHVYCQKPMCHDVAEVRVLTEAAVRRGVVTQLGTQLASGIFNRTAVTWLKEGRIGKIKHAYLCSNRRGAVETYRLVGPRPAVAVEPPASLNWDWWLGTAPTRSFAPDIYHPIKWRAWQDFGTGWSGDIGCHIFDPIWKGLGMKPALDVVAEVQESWKNSPARRADTWPQGDHITWTFPGNELTEGKTITFEWFDGEFYPPEPIRNLCPEELSQGLEEGSLIIGTEGALLIPNGSAPHLLPREKFTDVKVPKLPKRDHYCAFVDACLGGEPTESHFAQTGPMTEAILLGTIAIRLPGEKLEWDHVGMKFTNHPEANRYLKRAYRNGWQVAKF
jgi:predicted dehydrogenase